MLKKTIALVFAFCLIGTTVHATISGGSSSGGGGAPTGTAGGDLSGSYPNPTVATIGGQTLGSSAFQPTTAFDAIGAAAMVKSYFTGLTGYLSCTGSGCSASVSIPGSAVSGNITGNAVNVTGIVPLANGGTGASSATTVKTTLANAQDVLLPKLRACISRVVANAGNCTILAAGDSTTAGNFSNNSITGNWYPLSYPTQLAAMLNNAGINANANSIMGFVQSANSPYTAGTDWSYGGSSTLGGTFAMSSSATNSSPLVYNPPTPVDTYKVYYINTSGGGTVNLTVNGVTTSQSMNAATSIGIKTITTTLGTAPLTEAWASGGTVYVIGTVAYNSAISQVNIVNAGWGGSKAGDWATTSNAYSPQTMLGSFGQDATILDLGINDWVAGTGLTAYNTSMQALVTAAKTQGDVMLVSPAPSISTASPTATQATYVAALQSLAISNSLPYVDMYDKWVSYAVSNPLGLYATTSGNGGLHPNGSGYSDFARSIFQAIGVAGTGSRLYNPAFTGAVSAGALISTGTKFTTSGCSVSATAGGATAGTYISGTAGTCTTIITPGLAAPTGWNCQAEDRTTPADAITETATTTATVTLSGTTASGDVIGFHCIGY